MTTANRLSFWAGVVLKAVIIFAPLFGALCYVVWFESRTSDFLLLFNNIEGNTYLINDVMLAFLVSSYVVIFIGLVLYFLSILSDLSDYRGRDRTIRWLNTLSLIFLLLIGAALILYLGALGIAVSSHRPDFVSFHQLVMINKWLSLGVFVAFLIADLLAWRSQVVQEKESTRLLSVVADNAHGEQYNEYEKQVKLNGLLKRYAKEATFFVNVPTLLLNGSIVWLTSYLDQSIRLRGKVDPELHLYEVKVGIQADIYSLFINGVETGAIVCTIVFSQLIYLIIKTRSEWKIRTLRVG